MPTHLEISNKLKSTQIKCMQPMVAYDPKSSFHDTSRIQQQHINSKNAHKQTSCDCSTQPSSTSSPAGGGEVVWGSAPGGGGGHRGSGSPWNKRVGFETLTRYKILIASLHYNYK
jgi:hypothetical protein